MKTSNPTQGPPHGPGQTRRRGIRLAAQELVQYEEVRPGQTLPLVVRPAVKRLELCAWADENRGRVEELLLRHGGLLFRGFGVASAEEFERFVATLCGELLEYKERSSPRTRVSGRVYSSTDYTADQGIFPHNENSYQTGWPRKIFFFCETPPDAGGETPVADCRRVLERIDPELRRRFVEKGWMYVRNFGDGFGLDWRTVFQTTDRAAVEEHCRRHGIAVEWKPDGRLRTRAVRRAVARHPQTGEWTWFNHATFFHVTTLEPSVRDLLRREFADEDLPTHTFFGDGSVIDDALAEELRAAYRAETVSFPWERGDVMLLDNMMVAHGRSPYEGERRVLVAMAEPVTQAETTYL